MNSLFILSRSPSFERHLASAELSFAGPRFFHTVKEVPGHTGGGRRIVLLHASSFTDELSTLTKQFAKQPGITLGIAADVPRLEELLSLSLFGINAYFNSYMADLHYRQMLELLATGQTWFAPDLLARALELARRSVDPAPRVKLLAQLTPRQREIALAVAKGMSNQKISSEYGITERTVKTHLTHIFRTLELHDRTALAIKLSTQSSPLN